MKNKQAHSQARSGKPVYYAGFKPFDVLTQFSDSEGRPTLKVLGPMPTDVYPVGRLDRDSEGLLLLTNDRGITNLLLHPLYRHEKEYYVLVEGLPDDEALAKLEQGVVIEGKMTLPARARRIDQPVWLPNRMPPPSLKPSLQYSWISLTIVEGRNRQVRKMTAAVGHPTMRLIRWRIANITLAGLECGKIRQLSDSELSELKHILSLNL